VSASSIFSVLGSLPRGERPDYRRLAFLSAGYLLTLAVPRQLDRRLMGRLGRSSAVVREAWVQRIVECMQQVLGSELPGADFPFLARDYCEMTREIQWIRFRAFHTEKVPVETSVEGLHRVQEALDGGCGAILWGMSFCETLLNKIALHRVGLPLVLLSSAYHGVPANTRLGVRVVGPFYAAPENRFLSERIVIPPDASLGYVRTLTERLAENRCVSIRGDLESRRTNVLAPVFGREMRFAVGAPGLSWKLGSPLLPMHVVRDGPFRYRVIIHPPVEVERDLGKKSFVHQAVLRFAALLERCARQSPSNWEIWAVMA
jgi:lauroyl/myristoyl acyltransferase